MKGSPNTHKTVPGPGLAVVGTRYIPDQALFLVVCLLPVRILDDLQCLRSLQSCHSSFSQQPLHIRNLAVLAIDSVSVRSQLLCACRSQL
jgi:hypothetical protein